MAVKSYVDENGATLWKVYVNIRSKSQSGKRTQRKLMGIKTEREAEREEIKLIRECEREIIEKEAQGSEWGSVVAEFEKYLESPKAETIQETTRWDYVAAVKKHTRHWWKKSASEISRLDMRELIAQLDAQGLSASHQLKMKVVIGRVFNFGMDRGLIRGVQQSPTIGIKLGRDEEKKPEILTIDEIRKLLQTAKDVGHRWYPIWAMALLTGMRNGELYALLWSDIDWVNNAITVSKSFNGRFKCIKCTKSGHWRTVPISSELKALLLELKAKAGDRPSVLHRMGQWTRGYQASELRQFCVISGLPSVRFHALRACFATQLIRNGVAPIQIQKICGWKDLKTMQRYIRLAGIEVTGATETLKVLPEPEFAAKVVNLFTN